MTSDLKIVAGVDAELALVGGEEVFDDSDDAAGLHGAAAGRGGDIGPTKHVVTKPLLLSLKVPFPPSFLAYFSLSGFHFCCYFPM